MYVAHVGDSRVVMATSEHQDLWRAHPLTIDHKPENAEEKQRIEKLGGAVIVKNNVPRVVWFRQNVSTHKEDRVPFLAIARSLGDLWSFNKQSGEYIVSPMPDVRVVDMSQPVKCLVLGSDGLFNVLTSQEVVNKVQEIEGYNEKFNITDTVVAREPARELVDMALSRWEYSCLRSDNVSAICVSFVPLEVLDTQSEARLPLNHLNQNRTCGVKRSRSLDSMSMKRPKMHTMDLRSNSLRERACKRASSAKHI